MDNLIGQVLNDRYNITEIIGVGGMSVVYKAFDLDDGKYVAVKVLKPEFGKQAKFRKRFMNESKAIAMMSHKNIVKVFDVEFGDELQYIVMEYIQGRTLKEYINQYAPLAVNESIAYCGQVLNALIHAHGKGVVHRDIKPQNIMLLDSGVIKVTDFGIAHVNNADTVTMTDNAIGSVHYISPEQARGQHSDERADIYSIGIMLYEMVTGQLPFEADAAVTVALMQVQDEPKHPTEVNPGLPKGVEQIIIKALQKDAASRYQTAAEMKQDILALLEDAGHVFDSYPEFTFQRKDSGDTMEFSFANLSFEETSHTDVSSGIIGDKQDEQSENSEDEKTQPEKKSEEKQDNNKELSPEEYKKRRNKGRLKLFIGRLISALLGMALACVLVFFGTKVMFGALDDLSSNLIEIPNLVGSSINDVLGSKAITSNFTIKQSSRYDSEIGEGIIIEQSPDQGSFEQGKEISVVVSAGPKMITVPKLVDLTAEEASVSIKNLGLYCEKITQASDTVDEGKVIASFPDVGNSVPEGSTVKIYVAVNTSSRLTKVTDYVGMTKDAAMNKIYQQSLIPVIQQGYSNKYEAGIVYAQGIESDTEVEEGTEVIVYVSLGSDPSYSG